MTSIRLENQSIRPDKIACVGRNYVEHIKELNNEVPEQAVIFLKPNSAISEQIRLPDNEPIHYEAEISLLVQNGRYCAVAFGLDLTKRALQDQLKAKGLPWERAKAFDGAAIFSHFVTLSAKLEELRLELWIDQQLRQHGAYSHMLHKPQALLKEIQSFISLNDGDIVMTGTPAGVGKLERGQQLHGKIFAGNTLLVEHQWQVQ